MTGPRRRWFPLDEEGFDRGDGGDGDHDLGALHAARPAGDAQAGPRSALSGRVVQMDAAFTVLPQAVVYIERGNVTDVRPRGAPPPAGFEGIDVVPSGGTIYPGLIELHNHLSYNVLPLWSPVPRRFEHRGQWPGHADYRRLISGPMTVIGQHRDAEGQAALLAPLVRYVECKCLMGGVTTSQGIMLNSNSGVQRYYRGLLRNVEQTDDAALSEAQARIADVDAKSARGFLARLNKEDSCFLLHLSEGITREGQSDSPARRHFLALQVARGEWALNDRLAAIHSAGLLAEDFEVLARHGGAMVWSPLSNLLLYGATARVEAARRAGVRIGLGSDWSPSGSKNLLGELKVAWLHSQQALGGLFTARDLVAMATCDAAAILRWQAALGSIEPGKRADLLVITGRAGDPYEALIRAPETAIRLVMVDGVPRYGMPGLLAALGGEVERWRVGGRPRALNLAQAGGDPDVPALPLVEAQAALRQALAELPRLAREIEARPPAALQRALLDGPQPVRWTLALDEIQDSGIDLRPRLPFNGPTDFTGPERAVPMRAAAPPLSQLLQPVALDPLTVADDPGYLPGLAAQPNLPAALREGLAALYGRA